MRWADYVATQHLPAAGMTASSVDKNVAGLTVPYGRRMPDGTRDGAPVYRCARHGGGHRHYLERGRHGEIRLGEFPPGRARRRADREHRVWREMHRVRSVEENWTSGTGLGFDISRINNKTWVGHGGGYPGNTTQTFIQLDDKVGVIVLTNTNDSNPGDIARQLIATVGAGGREGVGEEARNHNCGVGPGMGALRGSLPRARGRLARGAAEREAGDHHSQRRRTWTTRSRWSRSAAGASATPHRPEAASSARWCDSSSSLGGRRGCTPATAGSTVCVSRDLVASSGSARRHFTDAALAFNAWYLLRVASISADSSLKTACC